MSRSTDAPLYPDEAEIARRVLGGRAQEWPGKAAVLERDGLAQDRSVNGRSVLARSASVVPGSPRPYGALAWR
jgi:hypothetical protein